MKNLFYNPEFLLENHSLNPQNSKLFEDDIKEFKQVVKKICEKSNEERLNCITETERGPLSSSSSLNFGNSDPNVIKDKMTEYYKNPNMSMNDKISEFKKWFKENYINKIKIK